MSQQYRGVDELWTQHQRRNHAKTQTWTCPHCLDRRIFSSSDELWNHALLEHQDNLPQEDQERQRYRSKFEVESLKHRNPKDDTLPRKPTPNETTNSQAEPSPSQSKRPLSTPTSLPPTRTLSALGALNLSTPRGSDEVTMQDVSDDGQATADQPRKRAALGDGISAGSASPNPLRDSSASPPPRRSKARPTSAPHGMISEENRQQDLFDSTRPHVPRKKLWSPEQDSPLTKSSLDPSNIASTQLQKSRAQSHRAQTKPAKAFQPAPQIMSSRSLNPPNNQNNLPQPGIFPRPNLAQLPHTQTNEESYDIILQPETRPISQEQLVAEVKGIYAGLVMVEAKCIEVDNKQATLAQADPGAQPKLNNEQWQALIALHRTLLHEHHDFFLASQHPSASPALRRLASKYAMPARMWRHGIHSFLELLRHRLPASLDHMLAFIYLAYSMMALLYETVPAFEDTWIECLGDLGRYRMAIEDDDIRDREVWTGVARHWYSRASDKAPTTGRLYHHLAILARPNALQQLFYYSKSLSVDVPFTSARESVLTLFEPVINASNGHGQYRLPPLDNAFVRAHGLLFTNKNMEKFEPSVTEFLGLLDNQIGRVTRKFMEQGYYISIANSVAMLGFAAKDTVLMQAIADTPSPDSDVKMTDPSDPLPIIKPFEDAERLSNATILIVLQRIGDPNVLPFIHVTLVFMYYMARRPRAMRLLESNFPWQSLTVMLNTLMSPYGTPARFENPEFPLPVKDDVRPFTEDFAMRGLLWAQGYFPEKWFSNDKIDDEEKYLEVASMTGERKDRILWLACRIASLGSWIYYDSARRQFSTSPIEPTPQAESVDEHSATSQSSAFASATTIAKSETWPPAKGEFGNASDEEQDVTEETFGDGRLSPGKPESNG